MGDDDYYTVLQHEFAAEEGSFLLQLRCDFVWDRTAFTRLTDAMLACRQAYDEDGQSPTLLGRAVDSRYLPRWLAEGFWYVPDFVEGHTSHPAWKKKFEADQDYYDRAYDRLRDLVLQLQMCASRLVARACASENVGGTTLRRNAYRLPRREENRFATTNCNCNIRIRHSQDMPLASAYLCSMCYTT